MPGLTGGDQSAGAAGQAGRDTTATLRLLRGALEEVHAPTAAPVPAGTRSQLSGVLDSDETERARQLCLAELERAPRSRAELAALLARKEVAAGVGEAVLERFVAVGLVDDRALAESWVALRRRDKGLSRSALAQELRRKGVEDEVVTEAVAVIDQADELEAARQLIARKQRATVGLQPQVRVRRLVGLLARKGYPAGVAFQVVRDALAQEDASYDGFVAED